MRGGRQSLRTKSRKCWRDTERDGRDGYSRHCAPQATRWAFSVRDGGVHAKIILGARCANRAQMTGAGRKLTGGFGRSICRRLTFTPE